MHIIKEEKVDFKDDSIKIDSLDSSKGILKIFININGENVKNNNENEPNFYMIKLKDFEVKNEFQDLSFNIVNNIGINLSMKVKNIIERKRLNSRLNMFEKKFDNNNASHNIISTGAGLSIKDKLKLINNTNKPPVITPEQKNKPPPKKIQISSEFTNRFKSSLGGNINSSSQNDKKNNENEKHNKKEDANIEKKNNKQFNNNNKGNKVEEKNVKKKNIEEIKENIVEEEKEENENKEVVAKDLDVEKAEKNKEKEDDKKCEEQKKNNKEEIKEEDKEVKQEEQMEKEEIINDAQNEKTIEEVEDNNNREEQLQEETKEQVEEEQKQEEDNEKENKEETKEKGNEECYQEQVENEIKENVEENKEENNDEKDINKEDIINEENNLEDNIEKKEINKEEEIKEKYNEENIENNNEENIIKQGQDIKEENKEDNIQNDKENEEVNNEEENNEQKIEENENKVELENQQEEITNEKNEEQLKEENEGEQEENKNEVEQGENKVEQEEYNDVQDEQEENKDEQEENKDEQEGNEIEIEEIIIDQDEYIEQENEKEEIEDNNEEKDVDIDKNEENLEDNNKDKEQEEIKKELNKENIYIGNEEKANEGEKNEIEEEQINYEEKQENNIEETNEENNKEENNEEFNKESQQIDENKKENDFEEIKEEKEENEVKEEEEIKEENVEKEDVKKEIKEVKPEKEGGKKKESSSFKKILSNMDNNKKTETNAQPQKAAPKKLDVNKFKRLIGERLIGQLIKKPNELMKKKDSETTTAEVPKDEIQKETKEPSLNKNISEPSKKNNGESEYNPMKLYKSETVMLEKEMEIYNMNEKSKNAEGRNSINSPQQRKSTKRNSIAANFGFEVLDDFENDISEDNSIKEEFLNSMNYEQFLAELRQQGKKEEEMRETFCEGFFIASIPKENGNVIENSAEKLPASCGHPECSKLPSMKPEIIMRYPLKDTKNLELNNLAATICFPTGVKMCYSENDYPAKIEEYVTQITNQKGERYYMRTFHFYHKMQNIEFGREYKIHPLKHHLMKFGDEYTILRDDEFTDEIINNIQGNLDFCNEIGFRDIVYIPYCICLISKYPYIKELEYCLDTIYRIMAQDTDKLNFQINDLIMYLIHSVPIPIKNMKIRFYIPYNNIKMELLCPKVDDVSIMNSTFTQLFDYLSVDNIILVFRLLLSEKKILFIHDDYTELTNITNSFITLLYPFKWIHTYIPIMSDQMLKYLETFLPFLNGIHKSLMKFVEDIFKEGELEESDEVFLVYINKGDLGEITLSSSLKKSKLKSSKFSKYIQNNVLPLPFEKELKKELKSIESQRKSLKRESRANGVDPQLENKMRDAFVDVFVKMFHDYEKYIGILDDDVIFNKVLFMNKIKKEEKKFYDEFIDCQLFQQFTQNILTNSYSYFNNKIKESKEKKSKDKKGDKVHRASINKQDSIYIARPDYLGITENDKNLIEKKLKEDYKVNKNETEEVKNKVLEKVNPIDSDKYINSNCIIYLTPEKKDSTKEEENKNKNLQTIRQENKPMLKKATTLLAGELTEKQIDKIKDDVKDMAIKIFKSEIKSEDVKALKTEAFRNLETSYGRSFFVSLISNNSTNVISLQENSFGFLENLINGILNSTLKLEETEQIIEEVVILIRSTKFFEKEINKKDKNSKKKEELNLFNNMKKKLQGYNKVNQKNFWEKWFELDLNKLDDEEKEDNNIREDLIIKICQEMIDLEISKSTIKNICDKFNKNTFEEGSELFIKTQKRYIKLISTSNYISSSKK